MCTVVEVVIAVFPLEMGEFEELVDEFCCSFLGQLARFNAFVVFALNAFELAWDPSFREVLPPKTIKGCSKAVVPRPA